MTFLTNTGVRAAISVLLLSGAVAYLVMRDQCCSMDSSLLVATLAIQPVNLLVIATVGWRFVLLARPPRPGAWSSLKASMLATGLNVLVPARGGDLIRLTYLRQREGTPIETGVSISVIERVADLVVLSTMAIVVGSLVLQSAVVVPVLAISALGAGLIMLTILLPLWLTILRNYFPASIATFLASVFTETAARVRDGKIFIALAASILFMGLGLLVTWIFFRIATESEFSWTLAAMVLVFASLGGAVPMLPGGVATFEAGVIVALLYGGYSANEALKLAVVYRLQQYMLATPLALLIATRERIGLSAMLSDLLRHFFRWRAATAPEPPAASEDEKR